MQRPNFIAGQLLDIDYGNEDLMASCIELAFFPGPSVFQLGRRESDLMPIEEIRALPAIHQLKRDIQIYFESKPSTIDPNVSCTANNFQLSLNTSLQRILDDHSTLAELQWARRMITFRDSIQDLAQLYINDIRARNPTYPTFPQITKWDYVEWRSQWSAGKQSVRRLQVVDDFTTIIRGRDTFDEPGPRRGPHYMKPVYYLACYFAEIGYERQDVNMELDTLAFLGVAASLRRRIRMDD